MTGGHSPLPTCNEENIGEILDTMVLPQFDYFLAPTFDDVNIFFTYHSQQNSKTSGVQKVFAKMVPIEGGCPTIKQHNLYTALFVWRLE